MKHNHHRVFAAVSFATLLAACGGGETMNSGTTGAGGSGGGSTGAGLECTAPQEACGGSCIDTSGDTENCGSCGHSCQGGACVASRCQPVTIATDQIKAYHIAVNSTGVYWNAQGSAVMMLPKAGGALIPLALGLDNDVNTLAADAKSVFWSQGKNVAKVPVGGGNVDSLATATQYAVSIAIDATSVYWADQFVGLNKVPIGGGTSVQLAMATNENPSTLAVNATSLFWLNPNLAGSTIKKVSIAGGAVTTLAAGIDAGEIVADENNVYWSGSSTKQINMIPVGGGPVTILGVTPYPPGGIAQDEENLYISSFDEMGAILKVAKTGGEPQVIASGHGFVLSLAVDATSVYWAGSDGMVLKVAK